MHVAYHGFRITGLQHILFNVGVYLDLNFQTTVMVTNDFAPAIRGKRQMELGGTRSSKTDAYVTSKRASCNTKHERHSSQKKRTLQERCGTTTAFRDIVHL